MVQLSSYLDVFLLSQVGHTKGYIQVLVVAPESMLGTSTDVKITSVGRWSVFGEVVGNPEPVKKDIHLGNSTAETSPAPDSCSNCMCSGEPEPCYLTSQNCGQGGCMGNEVPDSIILDSCKTGSWRSRTLVNSIQSLLLRKRIQGSEKKSNEHEMQSLDKQDITRGRLATLDWILICGMLTSFIIIVGLLILMLSN